MKVIVISSFCIQWYHITASKFDLVLGQIWKTLTLAAVSEIHVLMTKDSFIEPVILVTKGETITRVNGNVSFNVCKRLQNF